MPSIPALPRFMNRGLIEAEIPLFTISTLLLLPRFMNRGLIEADLALPGQPRGTPTSPIHESGPH